MWMKSARPISAAVWFAGRALADPQLSPDGETLAFVTSSADRAELALVSLHGGPEQWLPLQPAIRKGTGSFGWLPNGDGVVYLGADGCVHLHDIEMSTTRPLTHWPDALSALQVSPDGRLVTYVVDTHDVAIVGTARSSDWPRRISSGADFAFDPVWSPDARFVAWHEWDVPNMPWDGGRIMVRSVDDSAPIVTVAGKDDVAVQQPRFSPDGQYLTFLSDATGWLNLWVADVPSFENARPLLDEPFEHAPPAWGPGQRSYCWTSDSRHLVFTRNDKGHGRLCVYDVESGSIRTLQDDATFTGLHGGRDNIVALATGPARALTIDVVDVSRGNARSIARGPLLGIERAGVVPRDVEWKADDGGTIHGRLYEPSGREAPWPMIVWIHGGPTGQSPATLYPRWSYFLERGWAVFVVDYRGSTGWGRPYAQALRGRWAELDVIDVASAIRHATAEGWADPERVVAYGASSAGTTVLRLLSDHDELIAAGIALYPLADFLDFENETWRFEAHYLDGLIGSLPTAYDAYVERSPMARAAAVSKPVMMLHGDSDKVVPVSHTSRMADALRRSGATVECHIYEGEGHGWRLASTQIDELERIEKFLRRHVLRGAKTEGTRET